MRNPSIFIVALLHVKNRQTLQGLNGHATFEEPFFATFQQQFQYSLTINVFCNVDKFDTTAILRAYHSVQKISNRFFYIPTCNWNLRFLSIAVTVHIINKQRNKTVIIDHLKINCGQSQTTWNFSPDYKAPGRKSLTPSDGGLQPQRWCRWTFKEQCV